MLGIVMSGLPAILTQPGRRPVIVEECVALIADEVARKQGVSGFAVRQAFGLVRRLQNGRLIHNAVDGLLDEFAAAVDPFYQHYLAEDPATRPPFDDYLAACDGAPEALLAITDRRRQRIRNAALIRGYDALRPAALRHVGEAVPAIGRLIARHTAEV